jgi:hypothetical protein
MNPKLHHLNEAPQTRRGSLRHVASPSRFDQHASSRDPAIAWPLAREDKASSCRQTHCRNSAATLAAGKPGGA